MEIQTASKSNDVNNFMKLKNIYNNINNDNNNKNIKSNDINKDSSYKYYDNQSNFGHVIPNRNDNNIILNINKDSDDYYNNLNNKELYENDINNIDDNNLIRYLGMNNNLEYINNDEGRVLNIDTLEIDNKTKQQIPIYLLINNEKWKSTIKNMINHNFKCLICDKYFNELETLGKWDCKIINKIYDYKNRPIEYFVRSDHIPPIYKNWKNIKPFEIPVSIYKILKDKPINESIYNLNNINNNIIRTNNNEDMTIVKKLYIIQRYDLKTINYVYNSSKSCRNFNNLINILSYNHKIKFQLNYNCNNINCFFIKPNKI